MPYVCHIQDALALLGQECPKMHKKISLEVCVNMCSGAFLHKAHPSAFGCNSVQGLLSHVLKSFCTTHVYKHKAIPLGINPLPSKLT